MAVAPKPNEILRSTNGKDNFHRVSRLLISGGGELLRETFDSRCPPASLPLILQNPATKKLLNAPKLPKPQGDCLYPSPGVCGKSTDFDVTLLFKLLRTICSLAPPIKGWDALPSSAEHSLEADLARIKYYRNTVYAHGKSDMEIDDSRFSSLWREISETLVRIADQIHLPKEYDWQASIDKFLKDPLTAEHERDVEELCDWYRRDLEVKKSVEEVGGTTLDILEELKRVAKGETPASQVINEKVEDLSSTVGEVKDILREAMKEIRNLSGLFGAYHSIKEYQTSKNATGSDKQAGASRVEEPRGVQGVTEDGSRSEVLLDEATRKWEKIQGLEEEIFPQIERLRYMGKEMVDTFREFITKSGEFSSSVIFPSVVSFLCIAGCIATFFFTLGPGLVLVQFLFMIGMFSAKHMPSKKRRNDYNTLIKLLVKLQQLLGQSREVVHGLKANSVSYAQSLDDFINYMHVVKHSGTQVCIPDILIEKYTLAVRIRKEFPVDEIRKRDGDCEAMMTKAGEEFFMSGQILAQFL